MDWAILGGLSDEQRRELLGRCVRRRYPKGDTLFHEGDPGGSLHLLARGRVAIRGTTPMGETATFAVLGPGDVFGEQALLGHEGTRTATASALEAVETLVLQRGDFDDLRTRHASVEQVIVAILTAQVQRLSRSLMEALYLPAEKRVLRRLLDLCDAFRPDGADPTDPVTVWLTQDELASMAGTTRPTANRVLQAAVAEGAVALARGRIDVIAPGVLARRAR